MNRTFIFLLSVTVLVMASCRAADNQPQIQGGDVKLSDDDSAAYLDGLSTLATVSEAEAVKGIMLVLDQPEKKTFAETITVLREQKIVSPNWDFQADRPITKGRVAYMTYQACGIKGGLTLLLTGPSQRYCLKELQYRGLLSSGITYNTVTGMEYLAILGRIDEFRQTGDVVGASAREGGQE